MALKVKEQHKKRRTPVYSVDENGNIEEFGGLRVAGRAMTGDLNNSGSSIKQAINGERKTAYGRRWFYKEVV